ncbi:MAG: bifunctional oligoribonuclease/PAP phosphatase NrnA [Clostridia bacterium]|nr:bifunctional oligoribonuclease/PAP phosphatase NrnA [Clostridia bacterium]
MKKNLKKTMIRNNITLEEISSRIESADRIILICHKHPDGDTVGSAYALKYAYPDKKINVVCDDAPGKSVAAICGESDLSLERLSREERDPDLVITLDCASFGMTGDCGAAYKDRLDIQLDHHGKGDVFAENYYVDPDAAACAEIVYAMLGQNGRLNMRAAECVYCGVSTDTGCFKFSNTKAHTHMIAAELFDLGIDYPRLNELLFENKTHAEISAERLALNNLEIFCGGRVAVLTIVNEEKKKYRVNDDDLSVINSLPREISGVDLGIIIKQKDNIENAYKISMRSSQTIDVSIICESIGGGGHIRASGAEITADTADGARNAVFAAVKRFYPEFAL